MGKGSSKLSQKDASKLARQTQSKPEDVMKWYQGFKKEQPDGYISQAELRTHFKKFFPDSDETEFVRDVFRRFDKDGNGKINFKELMGGMAVTSEGNVDEKLNWTFNVYDVDESGALSREEMEELLKAMFIMADLGQVGIFEKWSPPQMVEKIFRDTDRNCDGRINRAEFMDWAKQDPMVTRLLCSEVVE